MLHHRPTIAALLGCIVLALAAGCGGGGSADGGPVATLPEPVTPSDTGAKDPVVAPAAVASSSIVYQKQATGGRVWVVNPDNDSVSVLDAGTLALVAEVPVGSNPRTLALAPDGRKVWVTNRGGASISVVDTSRLAVERTVPLPRASQPFGIVFSPADGSPWVVLEALGRVSRLDRVSGAVLASTAVGASPRHLSMPATGRQLLVSRFVSPLLPGEDTASPQPRTGSVDHGGELVVVDPATGTVVKTIVLKVSKRPDSAAQGRGLPNYLAAAAVSPDGLTAWVPSKQDNVMRGTLRDGQRLDFQTTVRAISSRIDLGPNLAEDTQVRVDHDNSGVASAAVYHPGGTYLFVALETSQEVAVVAATESRELFRLRVGKAPQGLAVSEDGTRLFVSNFMDRSVSAFDLSRLVSDQQVLRLDTAATVVTEKLSAPVLLGKQLFYDARDPRLARDAYLSCASCHADGGTDGRIWDFTGFGEGLRRTISLRGHAGATRPLHWSGNFDEIQDFEGQIRSFAGGSGLMSDIAFEQTSDPMGAPKAGASAELDALAAYLASLNRYEASPHRNADGSLTAQAAAGKSLFNANGCGSCHGGADFAGSASSGLQDVGTLKPASGQRLGGPLTGISIPSLRDAWSANAFLHDGSAATVSAAIAVHSTTSPLDSADLARLSAYVMQIGNQD
jgi:YVTN family beta-propeller protein